VGDAYLFKAARERREKNPTKAFGDKGLKQQTINCLRDNRKLLRK
jgi:hypothetical protein